MEHVATNPEVHESLDSHPSPSLSRRFSQRYVAAITHLAISVLIGLGAFALVFLVWYPGPFWKMSGGQGLFFLVVCVDVVIGPLITLVIFNPKKRRRELAIDLTIIALFQAAALAYGLWTISVARPVFAVYNVDRISIVRAADLNAADYASAELPEYRSEPLWGPLLIGTRHAESNDERVKMIDSALAGKDVSVEPKYYVPYSTSHDEVLKHAHPIPVLVDKNPNQKKAIDAAIQSLGRDPKDLRYLPALGREEWVAILDVKSGDVITYLPFKGF